jgi:hypothetical protein
VVVPLTEYLWNTKQEDIFLNSYLEKKALAELQEFEEQIYFDYFISPKTWEKPSWAFYQPGIRGDDFQSTSSEFPEILKSEIQNKTLDLATRYNQKSIDSLTNLFGDFISFGTLAVLVVILEPQIIILKSFLLESIYSLSDTIKSFLIIFGTDL